MNGHMVSSFFQQAPKLSVWKEERIMTGFTNSVEEQRPKNFQVLKKLLFPLLWLENVLSWSTNNVLRDVKMYMDQQVFR